MAIRFQKYFASITLLLGSPTMAAEGVWSSFTNIRPVTETKVVSVQDFIRSNIEPEYKSYVENGGFEPQWPEAPSGQESKSYSTAEIVSLDQIELPASEFDDLNQGHLSEESDIAPTDTLTLEEPTEAAQTFDVEISLNDQGKVQLNPDILIFESIGQKLKYTASEKLLGKIHIYTRDDAFIKISTQERFFEAQKIGESEIFIVYDESLHIVPVLIQDIENKISVPKELMSVVSKDPSTVKTSAGYKSAKTANSYSVSGGDSENKIVAESGTEFSVQNVTQTYNSIVLQVLDERSSGIREKLYPVGLAKIQIVGTDFMANTDNRGLIELRDLPKNSELLVRVADDDGLLQPSLFALSTGGDSKKIIIRKSTFETLQDMAHISQNSFLGSLCVNSIDSEGLTAEGLELTLDAPAIGPFYFNKFGMIDLNQKETGPNGRSCFFNIEPGATALHSYKGDEYVATTALSAHAGLHMEMDVDIFTVGLDTPLQIVPALSASAHGQLRSDHDLLAETKKLAWASLTPLGSGSELNFENDGVLVAQDNSGVSNGYIRLLSQSSDFEEMILHLPLSDSESIAAPLLPRGYMEDMAYYAQQQISPFDGHVLVDHNVYSNFEADELIEVTLYDSLNQKPAEPWLYKDGKMTKTLFFNLKPGLYSVIVKTQNGYWVDSRTVLVYSSTVSYVSTGAAMVWNENNSEK